MNGPLLKIRNSGFFWAITIPKFRRTRVIGDIDVRDNFITQNIIHFMVKAVLRFLLQNHYVGDFLVVPVAEISLVTNFFRLQYSSTISV